LPKSLLIALDYDETYTEAPELWRAFIRMAHGQGHRVICATMRYESETADMCATLKSMVKVIPTGRKAKMAHLKSLGYEPDIWIDDSPHFLVMDAVPLIGVSAPEGRAGETSGAGSELTPAVQTDAAEGTSEPNLSRSRA
jgi:hypothetical protein